jgi:hypothetical protein
LLNARGWYSDPGTLNTIPSQFRDRGLEQLDGKAIVDLKNCIPINLSIHSRSIRAIPMSVGLELRNEGAASYHTTFTPLPEEECAIARRNPTST